ncbi:MAG: HEAT repeat domain-containing protein, partial [Pirellulales bacterium]
RMAYQYLDDRGPWNREKMWQTHHAAQPAFTVPPVANLATGPSGVVFYPGTGLSDHFRGRFLLCDFRGSAHNSGVLSFRVKQKGATYEISDLEKTIWHLLATDVDFGPDGSIYVSDWVEGWDGTGKGRIYRFVDPTTSNDPQRREVQQLLSEGLEQRSLDRLVQLLSHTDRRLRLAAQFAMVNRRASTELQQVALRHENKLARLHAIWALQQFPENAQTSACLGQLLLDKDAEVRGQAAKVLGALQIQAAGDVVVRLLEDESPRVRHFAAIALGKLGDAAAIEPLLKMLTANDGRDPVLRHAGVMGLAGVSRPDDLAKVSKHPSASARMGALLALRRLKSPLVATFLDDPSEHLVVEAARAIHDVPIDAAYAQLAALILRPLKSDALLRRVLNANYRLGGAEHARALAVFAGQTAAPEAMRLEALDMLAHWQQPGSRDRVSGMWRPLQPRDPQSAVTAMEESLPAMLAGPDPIRMRAATIAGTVGIQGAGDALLEMFLDQSLAANARADALKMLSQLRHERLQSAIDTAMGHEDVQLRMAAIHALARHDPSRAIPLLEKKLYDGEILERQYAINVLATVNDPRATQVLSAGLDKLIAGAMPVEIRLELLQAAAQRDVAELTTKVEAYQATKSKENPLAHYDEAVAGGDVKRGKRIFFHHTAAACLRCHQVDGRGGDVGPDLSQIGKQLMREQLLESIVRPSRSIAKGYQTVQVATTTGRILVGLLRDDNAQRVRLADANGQITEIPKDDIDEIHATTKSAMPDDVVKHLSLGDLRDLVEYLASLQSERLAD